MLKTQQAPAIRSPLVTCNSVTKAWMWGKTVFHRSLISTATENPISLPENGGDWFHISGMRERPTNLTLFQISIRKLRQETILLCSEGLTHAIPISMEMLLP